MDFLTAMAFPCILLLVVVNYLIVRRMKVEIRDREKVRRG